MRRRRKMRKRKRRRRSKLKAGRYKAVVVGLACVGVFAVWSVEVGISGISGNDM